MSTLNGALVAVDKASGNQLWTLTEGKERIIMVL